MMMTIDDQPARPLKVLQVEDAETDALLIARELRKHGFQVETKRVWTKKSFLAALHSFAPDVILSDFTMLTFNGLQALELAREYAPGTAFIFVSGSIRPQDAADALSHGASAYLDKNNLELVGAAADALSHGASAYVDKNNLELVGGPPSMRYRTARQPTWTRTTWNWSATWSSARLKPSSLSCAGRTRQVVIRTRYLNLRRFENSFPSCSRPARPYVAC